MDSDEIIYTVTNHTVIRSYEFTKQANHNFSAFINSREIDDNSTEAIRDYLEKNVLDTQFSDYLKRYIYLKYSGEFPGSPGWTEVTDDAYSKIIRNKFKENKSPFSMEKTSRRPGKITEQWLSQKTVGRDYVFIIGFGLGMEADEVEALLKKGISEQGFNYSDYKEVIFRYCYSHSLKYNDAKRMIAKYETNKKENNGSIYKSPYSISTGMPRFSAEQVKNIGTEDQLFEYLGYLMCNPVGADTKRNNAYNSFITLLDMIKEKITESRNYDAEIDEIISAGRKPLKKALSKDKISLEAVQNFIYSGIRHTKGNNLAPMKKSSYASIFNNKSQLSRQRLSRLINGEEPVCRYDLLTLLFCNDAYDYDAQMEFADANERKERCKRFIAEANKMLRKAGMISVYAVNPYEAFLLLCMISEDPLETFSAAWEESYRH